MSNAGRGVRFLEAFNDIEHHLRCLFNADDSVGFMRLANKYASEFRLPQDARDALRSFASLRNAISHGRYFAGKPIAEPVAEVVEGIERLRQLITRPPTVREVLGPQVVRSVTPSDPLSRPLLWVREYDYSQFPVYGSTCYSCLLTTNAVSRWLADQTHGYMPPTVVTVADVLPFVEKQEAARLVPDTFTVTEALDALEHGGVEGRALAALIVTKSGQATEDPLCVVVADDVPVLMRSISLKV